MRSSISFHKKVRDAVNDTRTVPLPEKKDVLCYNTNSMILVTGGTGFIGQALVRRLVASGRPVRILLRPSQKSPHLPKGVSVEAAVSSLKDERGLRSALIGVDTIFHLAGGERKGSRSDLEGVDVEGSRVLAGVARQAGVERIIYPSHLGADRSSAYPVLQAKAIAEHFFKENGIGYTIFRCGPVFGPGDQFSTGLADLLRWAPGLFLLPGDGHSLIQPIWIGDLVECMLVAMEDPSTMNQTYGVGGGEYLTFREVLEGVMQITGYRRLIVQIQPVYIRLFSLWLEQTFPKFPISIFWLDYIAADRTCPLDTLPRQFGVIPARFIQNLGHLKSSARTAALST
jgi:NADH dehydrogenase